MKNSHEERRTLGKYIVKRVLLAILSILIVSAITFFVMNTIPGGPFNKEKATSAEAQKVLEERYNLDKPVPEQYVLYMKNLLHGDMGVSIRTQQPIIQDLARYIPATFEMATLATVISIVFGLLFGVISAAQHNKAADHILRFVSLVRTATSLLCV